MSPREVTDVTAGQRSDVEQAAHIVFSYLSETDPLGDCPYDAVMGFGMFDLSLPRYCGELYARRQVKRVIFTGGIGAGTGNLGGPEADVWRAELERSHPGIRAADIITENRSTNTGENVAFTTRLLERERPGLAFGVGIGRVIVVASPTRLRRVWLTLRRQQPALDLCRQRPPVTLAADRACYAAQGLDLVSHMLGELERIEQYPTRGWIAPEPLPTTVVAAREILRLG
jgi:hypothetical protein